MSEVENLIHAEALAEASTLLRAYQNFIRII
jgi:hypothetical protein